MLESFEDRPCGALLIPSSRHKFLSSCPLNQSFFPAEQSFWALGRRLYQRKAAKRRFVSLFSLCLYPARSLPARYMQLDGNGVKNLEMPLEVELQYKGQRMRGE